MAPYEWPDRIGGSAPGTTLVPRRRLGRAVSGSLLIHATLVMLLMWGGFRAAQVVEQPPGRIDLVYLPQAGPGGGGGGNPAPPAPARLEVPRAQPPRPVPTVQPTSMAPPVPDPTLSAVITNLNDLMRSDGLGAVNLGVSGGVKGTGAGPGRDTGIGPGTEGNFGGGPARPGNGCASPQPLVQAKPNYTTDAMRAKIQGDVTLDVIVRKDGTVGDLRITQSLDRVHGLDEEALKAAKGWTFHPATCKGEPVDMLVSLILEFRLH